MDIELHDDNHRETAAKALPAVQHSVDISPALQSHASWIVSVARALAIIVLLIGGFVFTASNIDGAYRIALSKLSSMGAAAAAGFLLAGLALYLQCLETGKLHRSEFCQLFSFDRSCLWTAAGCSGPECGRSRAGLEPPRCSPPGPGGCSRSRCWLSRWPCWPVPGDR